MTASAYAMTADGSRESDGVGPRVDDRGLPGDSRGREAVRGDENDRAWVQATRGRTTPIPAPRRPRREQRQDQPDLPAASSDVSLWRHARLGSVRRERVILSQEERASDSSVSNRDGRRSAHRATDRRATGRRAPGRARSAMACKRAEPRHRRQSSTAVAHTLRRRCRRAPA
jgi:hypothetical protein